MLLRWPFPHSFPGLHATISPWPTHFFARLARQRRYPAKIPGLKLFEGKTQQPVFGWQAARMRAAPA